MITNIAWDILQYMYESDPYEYHDTEPTLEQVIDYLFSDPSELISGLYELAYDHSMLEQAQNLESRIIRFVSLFSTSIQ